jgi:hypothetical protein
MADILDEIRISDKDWPFICRALEITPRDIADTAAGEPTEEMAWFCDEVVAAVEEPPMRQVLMAALAPERTGLDRYANGRRAVRAMLNYHEWHDSGNGRAFDIVRKCGAPIYKIVDYFFQILEEYFILDEDSGAIRYIRSDGWFFKRYRWDDPAVVYGSGH